jgi:glycosyltransferase involved in cell wall biosynthesis
MRILYVHNQPVPSSHANGIQVARMCSAFASLGHEVVLGVPPAEAAIGDLYSEYGIVERLRIVPLPRFRVRLGGRLFGYVAALYAKLSRFDLVYTRCPLTAYATAHLGHPVALELHMPPCAHGATTRRVLKQLLRYPALRGIVVISNAIAGQLLVDMGAIRVPVLVAHDAAAPVPLPLPSATPRPERAFTAVYAGHLYPGKGMEAITSLARRLPDVHFDVVGGSPQTVSLLREQLADVPNLRLHGRVPHRHVNDYLLHADIALAPFRQRVLSSKGDEIARWMSPLKLFEYMAVGKAIVASDLPALREVITHRENALLCPPDDIAAWCQAIHHLRSDDSLRQRLGANARQLLEARYTWEHRAKRVLDALC